MLYVAGPSPSLLASVPHYLRRATKKWLRGKSTRLGGLTNILKNKQRRMCEDTYGTVDAARRSRLLTARTGGGARARSRARCALWAI